MTSQAMGLPEDLVFRTKGQLATDILTDAFAGGVLLDFVYGDEVYGWCTELREFLEDHDQGYVLRVPSSFRLAPPGGITLTCKQAAARLGRRGWEETTVMAVTSRSSPDLVNDGKGRLVPATTLDPARDRPWTPEEVSVFLGVPVPTLYQWRHKGIGPKSHRVGRHLRYKPDDVRAWFENQA